MCQFDIRSRVPVYECQEACNCDALAAKCKCSSSECNTTNSKMQFTTHTSASLVRPAYDENAFIIFKSSVLSLYANKCANFPVYEYDVTMTRRITYNANTVFPLMQKHFTGDWDREPRNDINGNWNEILLGLLGNSQNLDTGSGGMNSDGSRRAQLGHEGESRLGSSPNMCNNSTQRKPS